MSTESEIAASVKPMPGRSSRIKLVFADRTRTERVLAWTWTLAPSLLLVGGVALSVTSQGTGRGIGIGLLLVGLIAAAVPISPVLRRRVERRLRSSETER